MAQEETLLHFVNPQYLFAAAIFFAALTLVIVCMIYVQLYVKKHRFRVAARINEQIQDWIGEALMGAAHTDFPLTPELEQYIRKARNREALTDQLITVRKNITGAIAQRIVQLYLQLGLKKDSLKRFRSLVWHQRAKGIYELYMMNQEAELPDIYRHTNSANEYVRMEAQIAIVGFWGFRGLTFLDTLEYPLHEWQQLKLLEQLSALDTVHMEHLPLWLQSGNDYVVEFALKLADIYRQMDVHDIVVPLLSRGNDKIRFQAIKTLGRIAAQDTAELLVAQYPAEQPGNKKEILRQLAVIGGPEHSAFLEAALSEDDDFLKLEAARALALLHDSVAILQQYATDATLESVIKQVRYELTT